MIQATSWSQFTFNDFFEGSFTTVRATNSITHVSSPHFMRKLPLWSRDCNRARSRGRADGGSAEAGPDGLAWDLMAAGISQDPGIPHSHSHEGFQGGGLGAELQGRQLPPGDPIPTRTPGGAFGLEAEAAPTRPEGNPARPEGLALSSHTSCHRLRIQAFRIQH